MKKPDMIRMLIDLMRQYRHKGVLSTGVGGSELLLPPEHALALVDELERIGVAIWGVDCWFYWDPVNKQRLGELVGEDYNVPDEVMNADDSVKRSADLVRDFIGHHLPKQAEFVSLFLEDAYVGADLFPDVPKLAHGE